MKLVISETVHRFSKNWRRSKINLKRLPEFLSSKKLSFKFFSSTYLRFGVESMVKKLFLDYLCRRVTKSSTVNPL
jgi:hypothetical protein